MSTTTTATSATHLPAIELPSDVPGTRITAYHGSAAVRAIGHELSHLDRLAAATHGRGQSEWLEQIYADHSYRVVTISLRGRLVGYAGGTAADGMTDLRRLVLAPSARVGHPEILAALVEAFVDLPATPWAQVRLDPASPALPHLLASGWRPTTTQRPDQAAGGDTCLTLTAAG